MPIIGLTDQVTPRFPRLGKLRKGGQKGGKAGYGPDLSYFRFTSDRPEIVDAFTAAYGEQPVALHVYLPYPTVDSNFQTWKEAWTAGGLQHRCDGQTCQIWLDKDGKYKRDPKPCPGGCDEVGRLEVILPELIRSGYVGYVTCETHSLNDILGITASLLATADARGDNPLGLRGIEFILRRKPEVISVPGFGANAGKRQRVEKYLVSLEPAPTWIETQYQLARAEAPLALLTDGRRVNTDSGELLDDEYEDEPEPAPAPKSATPAPPPQHGNAQPVLYKSQPRPWTGEQVVQALQDLKHYGEAHPEKRATDDEFGALWTALDIAVHDCPFPNNAGAFLEVAFGVKPSQSLGTAEQWALAYWAKPQLEGQEWVVQPYFKTEAVRVVNLYEEANPFEVQKEMA